MIALGSGRVLFARQLDDERQRPGSVRRAPVVPNSVDPRAHHLFGELDGGGTVGHGTLRLVHLERQMNTALQIEPEIDGDAPDRGVLHAPGRRVAHAAA